MRRSEANWGEWNCLSFTIIRKWEGVRQTGVNETVWASQSLGTEKEWGKLGWMKLSELHNHLELRSDANWGEWNCLSFTIIWSWEGVRQTGVNETVWASQSFGAEKEWCKLGWMQLSELHNHLELRGEWRNEWGKLGWMKLSELHNHLELRSEANWGEWNCLSFTIIWSWEGMRQTGVNETVWASQSFGAEKEWGKLGWMKLSELHNPLELRRSEANWGEWNCLSFTVIWSWGVRQTGVNETVWASQSLGAEKEWGKLGWMKLSELHNRSMPQYRDQTWVHHLNH